MGIKYTHTRKPKTQAKKLMEIDIHVQRVLNVLDSNHYCVQQNALYEPIYRPDGRPAHAYRRLRTSLPDLVKSTIATSWLSQLFSLGGLLWDHTTTATTAVTEQVRSRARQLPAMNRYLFSFRNGLLQTNSGSSAVYERKGCRFWPHPNDTTVLVGGVASNHFDVDFVDYSHVPWQSIPTPALEALLKTQLLVTPTQPATTAEIAEYERTRDFVMMLIGRMLFEPGLFDKWELATIVLGGAGTGKSTLIEHVIHKFYSSDTILQLDVRKGVPQLPRGRQTFVTTTHELGNSSSSLSPSDFLKIVSRAELCVGDEQAAHDAASRCFMQWPSHLFLAGNSLPSSWVAPEASNTTEGLIRRKCAIIRFDQKPVASSHALELLELEMPAIIQKCARAYRHYAHQYGHQDHLSWCPEYFYP